MNTEALRTFNLILLRPTNILWDLIGIHCVPDPGVVVADLGVDAGLVPLSAAVTPGDDALQLAVADDGAAGVSLARVLASLQESGAEHVGADLAGVGVPAGAVAQDGSVQAHQAVGVVAAAATGVAPAGDEAAGAGGGTAAGQGHGAHVAVEGGGLAELDQHDVVVQVAAAVAGVPDHGGGVDELLGSLVDGDVVLSQAHLDTRLVAVGGGHHPLAADEGAATEVVPGIQGHLVGHAVLPALVASHNLVVIAVQGSSERRAQSARRIRAFVVRAGQEGLPSLVLDVLGPSLYTALSLITHKDTQCIRFHTQKCINQ